MHWLFLSLICFALLFMSFGALSVWAAILMVALKALLVVPVVFGLYVVWQFIFRRKS